MKVLRFRSIEKPMEVECGSDFSVNGGARFPVHITWTSTGGSPTLTITNNLANPIKIKIFVGGVVSYDSSYFGDPLYQDALDSILESMYLPTEIIDNVNVKTTNIPTSSVGTKIAIKVYCPFSSSQFHFNLTC